MPKKEFLSSQKKEEKPNTPQSNIFLTTQENLSSPSTQDNNINLFSDTSLDSKSKIFYFVCKECKKPALVTIDIKTMKMNLCCDNGKNKEHDIINIPFREIFNNLEIKEKNIAKCQNCSLIIENIDSYECKTCSKIYCPSCFIEDINKNSHKDFEFKNKKCPEHNVSLIEYCKDCNENICIFCIKNADKHKNHKYESYVEIMPSNSDISDMNKNIEEREKFNNDLIDKINLWKKEVENMVDKLVSNLKEENKFLEKFFKYYNNNFINHTYFENFKYIKDYLKEKSNEDIKKFLNNNNFYDKTQNLLQIFKNIKNKDEKNKNLKTDEQKSSSPTNLFNEKANAIIFGAAANVNNRNQAPSLFGSNNSNSGGLFSSHTLFGSNNSNSGGLFSKNY